MSKKKSSRAASRPPLLLRQREPAQTRHSVPSTGGSQPGGLRPVPVALSPVPWWHRAAAKPLCVLLRRGSKEIGDGVPGGAGSPNFIPEGAALPALRGVARFYGLVTVTTLNFTVRMGKQEK